MNTLISCILPISGLCRDKDLYFLLAGNAILNSNSLCINAGTTVDFGTYFNIFSIGKWRKHTNVQNLSLLIEFEGKACIEIYHATLEGIRTKLVTKEINNHNRDEISIFIKEYLSFNDGILFFTLHALSDVVWYGAKFTTSSIPVHKPKIGIIITTYQRETEVKSNVAHLVQGLGENLGNGIDIIVVDNGKTLSHSDVNGAELLHNRNLGGSGGFMRGLLHCEDAGDYSHCLFMDDDAFCEVESIFRAIAFIAFAKKENTAIAGAMLEKERPHMQYENSAYFDTSCHAINHDFNLHDFQKICRNEVEEQHAHRYGAWWFFMFPITSVKHYAFPFFVRGDDILFSLVNDFTLITLSGVSCWHPELEGKDSPLVRYLYMRAQLLINTIIRKDTFINRMIPFLITFKEMLFCCFTYRYEYSYATVEAFSDYMKGPDFWCEHIDMISPKERINALSKNNIPINNEEIHTYCLAKEPSHLRYIVIFLCIFTLGGHLLPDRLLNTNRNWLVKTEDRGLVKLYWRKKYMTIISNTGKNTYKLDRKAFFKVLWLFLSTYTSNRGHLLSTHNNYSKNFDKLTSRSFWKEQL